MDGALGDNVADCVLTTFDALSAKYKPRIRNEVREWVPLSGIVLSQNDKPLSCAALGTGMKCLPSSKIRLAKGTTLHDWHAEVVAIRAFNRFLVDECAALRSSGALSSTVVRRRLESELRDREPQPFAINDDINIHMYCTEAPCGDASMELIMSAQEDSSPWELPPASTSQDGSSPSEALRGRGYFSELGIVRRKPSRPDAPPTLSKSCTDKLTLKQCTSLLSSTTSLLIHPGNAYLSTLILPASQHVPAACERAFSPSGRMSSLRQSTQESWGGGYTFHPFTVKTTSREFAFSRRSPEATTTGPRLTPSNLTAVYTPHFTEALIGGALQGRKQFDPRGASRLCRKSTWKAVGEVIARLGVPALMGAIQVGRTYGETKSDEVVKERRRVKEDVKREVLKGWVKNDGDDGFGLEDSSFEEQ